MILYNWNSNQSYSNLPTLCPNTFAVSLVDQQCHSAPNHNSFTPHTALKILNNHSCSSNTDSNHHNITTMSVKEYTQYSFHINAKYENTPFRTKAQHNNESLYCYSALSPTTNILIIASPAPLKFGSSAQTMRFIARTPGGIFTLQTFGSRMHVWQSLSTGLHSIHSSQNKGFMVHGGDHKLW